MKWSISVSVSSSPEQQSAALVAHLQTIARPGVNVGDVGPDTDLFESGVLDSLAAVQIILYLEDEYSIDLRRSHIDPRSLISIGDIMKVIREAGK